ncbi:TetR/AcrR family transcriptional regulator [Amycolatopsis rhabdoformis]|uniref:TetR/AcrR family transcriptional regulator n=1 Tax=Amycolatopsis rhabdoformis TaxID=1448059 RepID=A0ABZ1I2E7_9PSEU|nr:TetR/AcrR family transcriptional regulator [Amycolatopsis rhabdoformis]WSE28546.1 TetR/AcrR family transcriptional regulator [Amycolatopsis rhabdoformis]
MSLREQKKLETRQNISHVATRLFIARGFEGVTIAEVAEAARVAKMTVTNHFGRKEDLVFDIRNDFVDWPAKLVKQSPTTAFAAVRDGYFAALDEQSALLGFAGIEFVGMVRGSDTLMTALTQMHLDREQQLVGTLLDHTDPSDEILARTTAAHLTSVLRLLFDDVWDLTYAGVDNVVGTVREAAAKAFGQLEPALS